MNRFIWWTIRATVFTFIAGAMVQGDKVMARDWDITPYGTLQSIYSDRLFESPNQEGGLATNLSGALSLRSQSPIDLLSLRYQISWQRYLSGPELANRFDHRIALSDRIEWTGRFRTTLTGNLAIIPDSTLFYTQSQGVQSGEALVPRGDEIRSELGSTLDYDTSPVDTLNLGYSHVAAWYKDPALFDSTTDELSMGKRHQISDVSSRAFSYVYSQSRIKDQEDFATHSGTFFYSRNWAVDLSMSLTTGISYATVDHRFYPLYGGTITQRQSRGSFSISAMHLVGAAGGLVSSSTITDNATLQISRELLENLNLQLQETYSRNRTLGALSSKIQTLTTTATLAYRLSPHWTGGLSYEYLNQNVDGISTGDFNANRISVWISWQGEPWR